MVRKDGDGGDDGGDDGKVGPRHEHYLRSGGAIIRIYLRKPFVSLLAIGIPLPGWSIEHGLEGS